MEIDFFPPLKHILFVKIAKDLLLDPDIALVLEKKLVMPYRSHYFNETRHKAWEQIKEIVIEKTSYLPRDFQITVAHYVRAMHLEIILWMEDHDLTPTRKGFNDFKSFICWKVDGTIDSEQTAKKYVQIESIDARDTFIMACNYCLVEVIVLLWDIIRYIEIEHTSVNSAVRLWMNMLSEGCIELTSEIVEENMKPEAINPLDIPLRLSPFLRYLSDECRRNYFINVNPSLLQKGDFRSCLYEMGERGLTILLQSAPGNVLSRLLLWPYQSVFMEVAIKVVDQLSLNDFQIILDDLIKLYILNGYDYRGIFAEFWRIIPYFHKDELKRDEKKFKVYEVILNYGREKESKSFVETVAKYYYPQ